MPAHNTPAAGLLDWLRARGRLRARRRHGVAARPAAPGRLAGVSDARDDRPGRPAPTSTRSSTHDDGDRGRRAHHGSTSRSSTTAGTTRRGRRTDGGLLAALDRKKADCRASGTVLKPMNLEQKQTATSAGSISGPRTSCAASCVTARTTRRAPIDGRVSPATVANEGPRISVVHCELFAVARRRSRSQKQGARRPNAHEHRTRSRT